MEWKDGAFRAFPFELGRFYVNNGSVIRMADEEMKPLYDGPVLVEAYDDADYLSRSLDGAEAAFVKLALALGELLTHPVDSLVALKDLPAGVVALIASSPQCGPGPGQWGPADEFMSERSRAYQEQITGHSADEAYWVGGVGRNSGGVKFDGFRDGLLLEAKGPGYAKFFDGLEPKYWFRHSGAKDLVDQARRQTEKVRGMGVRIEWHVAESQVADALRRLLREANIEGIDIIHTPAR